MKKVLFLLAALAYAGLGSAQSIEADTLPALPPHVYCEITAHHLPTHRNNGVLFVINIVFSQRRIQTWVFFTGDENHFIFKERHAGKFRTAELFIPQNEFDLLIA